MPSPKTPGLWPSRRARKIDTFGIDLLARPTKIVVGVAVLMWSKRAVLTWMIDLAVLARVLGFVVLVTCLVYHTHVASSDCRSNRANLSGQDCRLWSKMVKNQRVYHADSINIG